MVKHRLKQVSMSHVNVAQYKQGVTRWDKNRSTCVQNKQGDEVLKGYKVERRREVDERSPQCGEGSRGQPGPLR